jgi:hypothetical protein
MLLSVMLVVLKLCSFFIHRGAEMDMFKYVNSLPHGSFANFQEGGSCYMMSCVQSTNHA